MRTIPANCCFLHQGAQACVVIEDDEEPTAKEIADFAIKHRAITFTGLHLVKSTFLGAEQTLLSSAQLDALYAAV